MNVTPWILCRVFCPGCRVVRTVLHHKEVEAMRCPVCDSLVVSACGDEA